MSPAALPPGWTWSRLADLAADEPHAITDGPFGSNLKTEHYTTAGPRVIRLQNIGDGAFIDERAHVSSDHFARLRKHEVKAGDVVVALLGERLPRACVIPPYLGPAIVKADCVRISLNPRLASSQFVNWWLNSHEVRRRATSQIKGVGRPRLNLSQLKALAVGVAPLAEQRRIVAKIEELFSDLDAGVAALQRVRANLKRYRAAVLKAAVEGRLTEEWRKRNPGVEPADKLLARILAERRDRWEQDQLRKFKDAGKTPPKAWKEKYAPPPTSPTLSAELPARWCWATVDQLAAVGTGTTPSRDVERYYASGTIPWVTSTAVNAPFISEGTELVTDAALQETSLRMYPARALLIALYGEGQRACPIHSWKWMAA